MNLTVGLLLFVTATGVESASPDPNVPILLKGVDKCQIINPASSTSKDIHVMNDNKKVEVTANTGKVLLDEVKAALAIVGCDENGFIGDNELSNLGL